MGNFDILVVSSSAFMQQLHGLYQGIDWIESLNEIHNLACITFTFDNRKLIEEMPVNLLVKDSSAKGIEF